MVIRVEPDAGHLERFVAAPQILLPARQGRVDRTEGNQQTLAVPAALLRQARIEWLVPIALVPGRTEALLAIGPKRSEEPYSGEDQDLLAAIAAAVAANAPMPE